jgi:hypothetical protein
MEKARKAKGMGQNRPPKEKAEDRLHRHGEHGDQPF